MVTFNIFQVYAIFIPVFPPSDAPTKIYLYSDFFKMLGTIIQDEDSLVVPIPTPGTDTFTLCQHFRSDGVTCMMSDVIPLTSIWEIVQLVPVFGEKMDMRLNSNTSLDLADKFYLNNFANKNTFHAILTYQ